MQITHHAQRGHHLLADKSVVLHCNHYNVELQNTILLPEYINGYTIQFNAAAEIAIQMLQNLFSTDDTPGKNSIISTAMNLYKKMGLGILQFVEGNAEQALFELGLSHYDAGWRIRFGESDEKAHVFSCGFTAGIMSFMYGKKYNSKFSKKGSKNFIQITEDSQAAYSLKPAPNPYNTFTTPATPEERHGLPCQDITDNVLSALPQSNSSGIIDAFGVYLTYLPSEYYSAISYEFEKALDGTGAIDGLARPLLIESGHVCGFHTFGGIMKSEVWQTVILPLLRNAEDWVYGMIAVINALGWGHWRVSELEPAKKLILQVYNSTEAIGYLNRFGTSLSPKCYMAEGAASAIMNLIYKGNIMEGPELSGAYYKKVFRSQDAFKSKETKCLAKGDPYCEFEFWED